MVFHCLLLSRSSKYKNPSYIFCSDMLFTVSWIFLFSTKKKTPQYWRLYAKINVTSLYVGGVQCTPRTDATWIRMCIPSLIEELDRWNFPIQRYISWIFFFLFRDVAMFYKPYSDFFLNTFYIFSSSRACLA